MDITRESSPEYPIPMNTAKVLNVTEETVAEPMLQRLRDRDTLRYEHVVPQTSSGRNVCLDVSKPKKRSKGIAQKSTPKRAKNSSSNAGSFGKSQSDKAVMERARKTELLVTDFVDMKDVIGLEDAKESLKEAIAWPSEIPEVFVGKLKPWKGVLLFGPPGTGKTHLVKATASTAGVAFFKLSGADFRSQWFGEAEKTVKAVFELARSKAPAVIFIDEIETLCGRRNKEHQSEAANNVLTEVLVEMQGVGSNTGVLLIGATNLPYEIDPAARRRFEKRIYIPLPNEEARAQIFNTSMNQNSHDFKAEAYKEFAALTMHFSGSDISVICRDAMLQPVRNFTKSTHFKKRFQLNGAGGIDEKFAMCTAAEEGAIEMSYRNIPVGQKLIPPVTMEDVKNAIFKHKATVSSSDLSLFEKFDAEFGQSCM